MTLTSATTPVNALAATLDAHYGRCEILVNNAAIADGTGIEKMTMTRYHEVIRVDQDGAVRMCLAFGIVNIASIMGLRGWPDAFPYSTAKAAIVNLRARSRPIWRRTTSPSILLHRVLSIPMSILADGSHEYDSTGSAIST